MASGGGRSTAGGFSSTATIGNAVGGSSETVVRQGQLQAKAQGELCGVQSQLEDAARKVAALRKREATLEAALRREGVAVPLH